MIRTLFLACLFLLFAATATHAQAGRRMPAGQDNSKLVGISLGSLGSMSLPSTMVALPPDQLASRYQMMNKPVAAYHVPSRQIDFTAALTAQPWLEKDLALLRDFQKATLQTNFNEVDFIKDEVATINGKKMVLLEFTGVLSEKDKPSLRKYGLLAYAVKKKKVVVFSFIANERDRPNWQEAINKAYKTIKI